MIGNRYTIDKEIGMGGMGIVFLGTDIETQEPVAIKRLNKSLSSGANTDLLERFRREGEALRQLNHPNIVKMLDAFHDDGEDYLILEYVSGGELNALLKGDFLPIKQILNIALDLADALTRAHRLDIIHRDIKPANVLMAEDGTPRLTDFGIARLGGKERVTATNDIFGTIPYMPPEALTGEEIDARADIWAFGIMLYEMLTYRLPFNGKSLPEIVTCILQEMPPDLEAIRSDIPVAFADLIYRMLQKDPNARIPSVRLVGAEIEAILQGRVSSTSSVAVASAELEPRFNNQSTELIKITTSHNLPALATPFVGRATELSDIDRALTDTTVRLVTLVSPGGMGKTRLAIEAARRQLNHFKDGVYFVELAPLNNSNQIYPAIGEVLHYQFQEDGRSEAIQVLEYLNNKSLLLVIDNWEHVIDGAGVVSEILNAAPHVNVLATSRQRLSQAGESVFNIGGLTVSAWETIEEAMQDASMQLFVNSAKRSLHDFEVTPENLPAITHICQLVQGMPLAIEMASAWLTMLSIEEIADEIDHSIDFLEATSDVYEARQKSIRAVFDYSWQQMTDSERDVFAKISVFKDGFTRHAVQKVTQASLRDLMSLANKSMLQRDNITGRYSIHELLRQYGAEKLASLNTADAEIKLAHATYFANYTEDQWGKFTSADDLISAKEMTADIENIRTAWQYWVHQQKPTELAKFVNSIWALYETKGWYQQAIKLYQAGIDSLAQDTAETSIYVLNYLKGAQAWFKALIGLPLEGIAYGQASISVLENSPLRHQLFVPLSGLNLSSIFVNRVDLVVPTAELMDTVASENNHEWEKGMAAVWQSYGHLGLTNSQLSEELGQKASVIMDALDNTFGKAVVHGIILGGTAMATQNLPKAKEHYLCGLEAAEKLDYRRGLQIITDNLGFIALVEQDVELAHQYFLRSLKISRQSGQIREMLGSLRDIAQVNMAHGNLEIALKQISVILHHEASVQNSLFHPISIREEAEGSRDKLEAMLATEVYQRVWEQGRTILLEDAAQEALRK